MAPRNRRRTGEGFSLVDLQPTLTTAVSTIADELSSQGVDIDTNSLLMGVQGLVNQLVMNNPGALMASDDESKPPYNLGADLLAMGYNNYHADNKREAIKHFFMACATSDTESLVEAFLQMNNKADLSKRLVAADDDTDDGDTEGDEDSDEEMTDEEIDDLIKQGEDNPDDDDSTDDEDEDNGPMGGTSSTKPVTASTPEERAKRILAVKMSSAGDESARKRAARLLR
jgi:hypothetical protein